MTTILSLTTYPTRHPRHGGQRRIQAFKEFYQGHNLRFETACVYESPAYREADVGPNDIQLEFEDERLKGIPFVSDLLSGAFAADIGYSHFKSIVAAVSPDVIQLDHPFMWPVFQRLRREGATNAELIYSSHNWEAPLKRKILTGLPIATARVEKILGTIETMERDCVAAAKAVVAVSKNDAEIYSRLAHPDVPVIVVPNGVNRPFDPPARSIARVRAKFADRKIFLFVGSAYPPNVQGFADLVSEGGFYFLPPEMHVAVCGSAADHIWRADAYQRLSAGNSARVQFYNDINDDDLEALKQLCHAFLLPITYGGGSNLKTAEALVSGKYVVATPTALRGFDEFHSAAGVCIGDDRATFRTAMMDLYHRPPMQPDEREMKRRESLYWDRAFSDSGLHDVMTSLGIF